ncbi:MAG TPA: helix-turn-helix transcriptional regulator [Clostridia bacterium]|nr:helix-turn-helix transcriptional regulator [Clostridia bacterium]
MRRTYKPSPAEGDTIKKILRDNNTTVYEFADEFKLSYAYVSQILSGSKIRPDTLRRMYDYVEDKFSDTKM